MKHDEAQLARLLKKTIQSTHVSTTGKDDTSAGVVPKATEKLDAPHSEPTFERNLAIRIENEKLLIEIDLSKVQGVSRTGRSLVISSTSGNMRLWDEHGIRDEVLNMSLTCRIPGSKPVRWYVSR